MTSDAQTLNFFHRLFAVGNRAHLDEVLELDANAAASLPSSRGGLDVEVLEGVVLVTESGDPDDHVLVDGQRGRFGPRGVAAMAFTPSRVRVRAGAPAPTAPRSLAWNGVTPGSSSR